MKILNKNIDFEQKKRANTGCLRGILYFLAITGTALFLAVFGWNCVNDVLALIKPEGEVTVTIPDDYTIPELSRTLKDLGVIEQAWLFTFYCNYSHAEETIEPGVYPIASDLDYNAIVKSFVTVYERSVVEVRITEGKSLMETLKLISEQGVSDLETLIKTADEEEFDYDFLEDVPMQPGRLEGYLYPDTYQFFTDDNPRTVLRKLLNNFSIKLAPSMRQRVDDIDYNLNEILTIASMVQLEAANISEMKDVASVIYNRLEKWSEDQRYLQIDAALVYMLGRDKEVTREDINAAKEIDSPYNTYMYTGLPPGPICSPSIEAIRAALYPSNSKYYYYAMGKDDAHHFFNDYNSFKKFTESKDFIYSD